jgi:glycosyltransferase involved in cell wall biosynthesis
LGHYLVLHKGARVRLKIAGQPRRWAGDYRRACQELAEKNGAAPNIEWCGPIRGEARPAFYQSLDLFLCPSHFESFGLTPLEALWQGIPVCVAPDVGMLEYLPSDAPLIRLPSLRKEDIASAIASFVELAGDWRDRSRPWRGRHALTRSNAEIACDFARVISDAKLA